MSIFKHKRGKRYSPKIFPFKFGKGYMTLAFSVMSEPKKGQVYQGWNRAIGGKCITFNPLSWWGKNNSFELLWKNTFDGNVALTLRKTDTWGRQSLETLNEVNVKGGTGATFYLQESLCVINAQIFRDYIDTSGLFILYGPKLENSSDKDQDLLLNIKFPN